MKGTHENDKANGNTMPPIPRHASIREPLPCQLQDLVSHVICFVQQQGLKAEPRSVQKKERDTSTFAEPGQYLLAFQIGFLMENWVEQWSTRAMLPAASQETLHFPLPHLLAVSQPLFALKELSRSALACQQGLLIFITSLSPESCMSFMDLVRMTLMSVLIPRLGWEIKVVVFLFPRTRIDFKCQLKNIPMIAHNAASKYIVPAYPYFWW